MIVWFTGQPGSGKSTLARVLVPALKKLGHPTVHLEGEFLRKLTGNTDFSAEGRSRNVLAGQRLAEKLHEDGLWVVASFVSPHRAIREALKSRQPVLEVYLHTEEIRGREAYFAPDFEPPLEKFLDLDTGCLSVDQSLATLLSALLGECRGQE